MKQRYFIELSYKGTNYHGWQIQPNAITVQSVLNNALSTILNQEINVVGAGRTDAGVHAKYFTAHFDCDNNKLNENKTVFSLNRFLPNDIAINRIRVIDNSFHARFDALSRTYKYYISKAKNPFDHEFSYKIDKPLNVERMIENSKSLLKYTDFTSFSKLHTDTKTNDCKIFYVNWENTDTKLVFTIKADRFLRNMVRAIVGTLIDVGLYKIDFSDFIDIIESKNRNNAGFSVPPQGLFLTDIKYPKSIL